MDAMIFAAGLGTRLRPLTDDRPKALVEIDGVTPLEHVARRLVHAGADRLIINTHPFPDQIRELVRRRDGFGVDVHFSHEPDGPLDTGGGLRHAAHRFRRDAPFFIHNCDIISSFDLRAMLRSHAAGDDVVATLALLPPGPERYLLFDGIGLCGYSPRGGGADVLVRPPHGEPRAWGFAGIHVASPVLLSTLPDETVFSIITHYLGLARRGLRIRGYAQRDVGWSDIGTPAELAAAGPLMRRTLPPARGSGTSESQEAAGSPGAGGSPDAPESPGA